MARLLALLETGSLFAVVSSMVLLWTRPTLIDWLDLTTVLGQALAVSLCCVVAFYYNDLYDFRIVRHFGAFASRLLQSFGIAFILLAIFYTLFPDTQIAGGPFVSSFVIILGLLFPLRAISYFVMRSRLFSERVLILGRSPLANKLIHEIGARPEARYAIVGIADDGPASDGPARRYRFLRPLSRLDTIIENLRPDRIVVAMAERRGRLPVDYLVEAHAAGIAVEDGVSLYERLTGKLAIEALTPSHLVFSPDFRHSHFSRTIGRLMSLLLSVIGLAATAPLLALLAFAIKLDSPGPILFVQDRMGRYGKRFKLIKCRTMHPTKNERSEWVKDNADRITRVGKWLRKFRLDELPQLINILRGDLNLVGPRPHPVSNYQLFIENIPYYTLRSVVRPGVTGWAQVRYGYANSLEEETEKMRYDLYYIKHRSLWFDLRILFDTVKIVAFGRGSRTTDACPMEAAEAQRR